MIYLNPVAVIDLTTKGTKNHEKMEKAMLTASRTKGVEDKKAQRAQEKENEKEKLTAENTEFNN